MQKQSIVFPPTSFSLPSYITVSLKFSRHKKKTFSLFFFPFQVFPVPCWQQSLVVGCWHSLEAFRNHSKFVKNEKTNFSAECILISYTPGERLLSFALLQHSHGRTKRSNSSSKLAEYIGWQSCVCVSVCVKKVCFSLQHA